MKLKLDENLPLRIAIELRARSHDVQTVGEDGPDGACGCRYLADQPTRGPNLFKLTGVDL